MRARLLVIQHEDDAPASWFGDWLEAAGLELTVVLAHRDEPVPETLGEYDGLLVLGGAMSAYDDETCAWLTPTKRLIASVVPRTDKAFLGICLGHQLAAVSLGGTVAPNPVGRALGLTPVRLSQEGLDDPLLRAVPNGARAVQWNDDVVTAMPDQAIGLAEAPDGTVQAARFGPLAWGVQFHPEVSPTVFASWGAVGAKSDPPDPPDEEVAAVASAVAGAEDELRQSWRPLAQRFADIIASTP